MQQPSFLRKFLTAAVCFGMAYVLAGGIGLADPVVIFAVGLLVACGAIASVGAVWDFGWECAIAWWIWRARRPEPIYGDARFATVREVRRAGLAEPDGLFLGKLGGTPLFYAGASHLLTVAPPRSGKGVSAVVPNLLHYQGSVFVTDPKGELGAMTAEHREKRFGQKVVIINPWGLHGLPRHRYNPLQPLVAMVQDPHWMKSAGDETRRLALQLLPEPDRAANNAYFRNGSRKLLRALMLHLATWNGGQRCTLPEIWRALASPNRMSMYLDQMTANEALDGTIQDLGSDLKTLLEEDPEHFGDFREGALQAVEIYDPGGWLGETVSGSDFALTELKEGRITIYLVIPQEELAAYGSWLGMMTRQAITAVARAQGKGEALFLLDEFGSMGRIEGIAESLTGLPGLGVRVWMILQSLHQIREHYGPDVPKIILGATDVKQFFAVSQAEALLLSNWLGQKTVVTESHSLGRGRGEIPTTSVAATGRPLMSPEEIVLMPREEQLLFVNNLPPIRAHRVDYRSVRPWRDWAQDNPTEIRPVRRTGHEFTMRYDREKAA